MSAPPASTQSGRFQARSILDWFQRNNVVALVLLLVLFVAAVELLKPGTVNSVWLSNTLLFAAPLGVLAAGQTMVMLTGGIDLSVVSVAMGSAFLMTTTALKFGNLTAVAIGLGLGLLWERSMASASLCLGVQPLVMTLGTGLMTQGVIIVYSQRILASRSIVPDFIHAIRRPIVSESSPSTCSCGCRSPRLSWYAEADRLRPPSLCDRRQPRRLPARRGSRVAALAHRLHRLCAARVDRGIRACRPYQFRRPQSGVDLPSAVHRGRHHWRHLDLRRPRRLFGHDHRRTDPDVLDGLLTLLDSPEPIKQILYGAIIFTLAAAYSRLTA